MKTKNSSNKKNTKSTILVVISIVVFIIAALSAVLVYAYHNKVLFFAESQPTINLSPPTEQEIKDSQDGKKSLDDQESTNPNSQNTNEPSSTQQSNAEVGISLADVINQSLEIRAFTASVIDGSGTCTATISKGASTLTRNSDAFIDTSTTQCGHISIPLSELSAGVWSVSVRFNSNSHNGASEKVEVTIP